MSFKKLGTTIPVASMVFTLALICAVLAMPTALFAQNPNADPRAFKDPTPIGAWFGVARPCVYPTFGFPLNPTGTAPIADPAPDAAICNIAGAPATSAPNAFPVVQVTMIPTLLADGTVLADDFAELLDHHTTAHGKWENQGKVKVDGKWLEKYQATFVWFSGPLQAFGDPANPAFIGSIRPRFVTFFDKDNPDEMRGYIQPYLYRYTTASPDGIGAVKFDSTGKFPVPSPADPLPNSCDPSDTDAPVPCLGTLHFYIHRIPAH